ncbi:hypothetical protein LBMAG56_21400 [Verrucomicrobiota bacterium]|nr:hypothetical protein LBMAG56_21400 [Verrucomicrobiota bacterium]
MRTSLRPRTAALRPRVWSAPVPERSKVERSEALEIPMLLVRADVAAAEDGRTPGRAERGRRILSLTLSHPLTLALPALPPCTPHHFRDDPPRA